MSRELGVQVARQAIRVRNALCPGPVNTPLLQKLFATDWLTGGAASRLHVLWAGSPTRSAQSRRVLPRLPTTCRFIIGEHLLVELGSSTPPT